MQPLELPVAGTDIVCPCVSKHVPRPTVLHNHHIVPKYLGGGNDKANLILLCPNSHDNIHSLLRQYGKFGGRPPGYIRKHYSEFVQDLAHRGWVGAQQNMSVEQITPILKTLPGADYVDSMES